MEENSLSQARDILLDSNILQYYLQDSALQEQILQHLAVVRAVGSVLAISEFTLFELINTSSEEQEKNASEVISGLKRYEVKEDVLLAAARLGSLYKTQGVWVKEMVGDQIIGATSIIKNCVLYTCDAKGFPAPFFVELDTRSLTYTQNGVAKTITGRFKVPDHSAIEHYYAERAKTGQQILLLPPPQTPN